jgi:DNA processing protein
VAETLSISPAAVALSVLSEHHSRATIRRLLSAHRDPQSALAAAVPHPDRLIAQRLSECGRVGAGIACSTDPEFPALLGCIPDAPLVIHYRGSPALLRSESARPAVAVVGARRASVYARELAMTLAADLAGHGFAVVSGLALGVDAAAHRGALNATGATLAVLGSGVDRIRPAANAALADALLSSGGALLSEYPPGTPPAPFRFPERNRLISGLALGVLVVEASGRSGSLITARLAAEQGREVMAVPAPPGLPNSAGTNRLLKAGAALIETAADVLDALGLAAPGSGAGVPDGSTHPRGLALSPGLARILDHLQSRPRTLDELAAAADTSVPQCVAALAELELGGFVERVTDGYIRRPSEI